MGSYTRLHIYFPFYSISSAGGGFFFLGGGGVERSIAGVNFLDVIKMSLWLNNTHL